MKHPLLSMSFSSCSVETGLPWMGDHVVDDRRDIQDEQYSSGHVSMDIIPPSLAHVP